MRDFELFCAGCARPMSYQESWRESLSKVLVCSKECLDKVQIDYCSMIVVKAKENL